LYIVLEGIVGSGKTTQVKRLGEYLHAKYPEREIVMIREPGSTPIAEDIRSLAQGKEWVDEMMYPLTNAYLYTAARAQTLHTIVRPALGRGAIVISDRSFLSSCVIQWEAQGLGIETIIRVNEEAIRWLLPDIVLYLDIDIDLALSRIFDQSGDKFEREGREFYEAILRGYEKCSTLDSMKNRFIKINASGEEDEVFACILEALHIHLWL
jgi:dTMP kinase